MKIQEFGKKLLAAALCLCMVLTLLPVTALAEGENPTLDIIDGSITLCVSGNALQYKQGEGDWTKYSGSLTISGNANPEGAYNANRIIIESGTHAVNFQDLYLLYNYLHSNETTSNFAVQIQKGATLNLTLLGENRLKASDGGAGLQVEYGATLNITAASTGSLYATGGFGGAGIGSGAVYSGGNSGISTMCLGCGTINIAGGTVTATGGDHGAGIGSSGNTTYPAYPGIGTITITGGRVTANGGTNSAGIGGGKVYNGGDVFISGGTVVASGQSTYGIGGGGGNSSITHGSVTITGGSVNATIGAAPTDGTNSVAQVIKIFDGNAGGHVTGLSGLPQGYGTTDLYTDGAGKLYLWLPAGYAANDVTGGSFTFDLLFDSRGGSAVSPIKAIASGATVTLPGDPTRSGFTFAGWYTAVNGGGTQFTGSTPVTSSITLYAKWILAEVFAFTTQPQDVTGVPSAIFPFVLTAATNAQELATIQWYACDASGTISGNSLGSGGSYSITSATNGVHYYCCKATYNGTTITSRAAMVTVQESYMVGFFTEKGVSYAMILVVKDNAIKKLPEDPVKKGYLFGGWYTAGGTEYTADSIITEATFLYAKWTALPKLATPASLAWDTTIPGKATWGAVTEASSYSVQLYKGDTAQNDAILAIDTSYDFTSAIAAVGTGSYYFAVTAIGDGTNYTDSDSATSAAYAYTAPVSTVSTPSFSPTAGTYTSAQSVTLSCTTAGATIRYTTDGSDPTESIGTVYTSAIAVSETTTIKAKAFKTGVTASEMASATYTIGLTPTIAFTAQPVSSTSVTAGSITGSLTAAATVTPSGTATLNWFACNSSGTASGVSLGTGGTFAIPTTLTAGTYYYLCQATYSDAMTVNSNVATVTVNSPAAALGGEITLGTNSWKQFLNTITFGLFFKDTQTVTVTGSGGGGTYTISYFTSAEDLSEDAVKAKAEGWQSYTAAFSITPDADVIVYARITDGTDTVYLRSDRITVDGTAPTFSLANGTTYNTAQTLTVSDNYALKSVLLDGTEQLASGFTGKTKEVTLSTNGTYTIKAIDHAGNEATISVTINIPAPPATYDLVSITDPTAVTGVANGTALNSITLPSSVTIDSGTGGPTSANVTWDLTASSITYDPATETEQTFSIPGTVTLPNNVTNTSSVSLNVSVSVTVAEKSVVTVTGVAVKTQPTKTTYTEGDALDLSGLEVTLNYSNGSTKDVALVDFGANGVTANPANGATLSTVGAINVVITVGNATVNIPITVNTAPVTPTIAFTTQPVSSTSVTAGSITGSLTAAASVTPSGEATLNWFACDSSGTISGSSLGTGGSFTIPTTLTAGTYYYLCQATCSGATTVNSNVATVTVSDAPATAYTISVSADPTAGGTATGGGTYNKNDSVTVAVTANSGYHFVKWTEGGTQVSTSASYTFSVTADRTLVAVFEADTPTPPTTYTVTVNGSYAATTGAGNYAQGDTVYIYAGTRSDYSFSGWTVVSGSASIINADRRNASFTMPGNAVTVKANWTYNGGGGITYTYYTITATAGEGGSISPSGSVSVREGLDKAFTITPKDGYVIDDVTVDGVSVKKQIVSYTYTFENVQKSHTIKATFIEESKVNPDTGVDNPFTDVKDTDWFFKDVMFVYDRGLMIGTSDTTFSPYSTTTRATVATTIWRMEGKPTPSSSNPFADVESGKYYTDAVTWAKENSIVAGYSATSFGPNDPVTREQLAMFFYNYAKYKGYDTGITGSLDKFTDKGDVSDWAQDAMQWAVGYGLIQGKTDNTLDPKGNATRAEFAAMLHRFIEKNELVEGVTTTGLMGWIDPKRLGIPNTGDTASSAWPFVMFTSLAACAVLILQNKRREDA